MSMRSLESAILAELREIIGKRTFRMKDVMEWSTGSVAPSLGETYIHCPRLKVNTCVLTSALPKTYNGTPQT